MAVIRGEDPEVIVADSMATLDRVLAFEFVAKTPSKEIDDPAALEAIRQALLEEQWGTAVAEWTRVTGIPVDVWADSEVWTQDMLDQEFLGFEFQFSPVFKS